MSKARELASLGNAYSDGALSNRNLIINGAMQVAQRGTTGTSTGGGYLSVDRYSYVRSGYTPSMTRSQEVDGPAGFSNSYKALTAAAAAVPVSGYASIFQTIEAQNLQHLNYGSADAAPITLSFWVKSNVTGTFAVSAVTFDTSIMYNSLTYTVSSANTWEYKTVTFAGQTVNAIDNDNGAGLRIEWCLSSGTDYTSGSNGVWSTSASNRFAGHATDITGTLNNYLAITGVQLEVGDTATPFEHRSYGQELALCQRYYEVIGDGIGSNAVAGICQDGIASFSFSFPTKTFSLPWKVTKRVAPSVTYSTMSGSLVPNTFIDTSAIVFQTTGGSNWGYYNNIKADAEL